MANVYAFDWSSPSATGEDMNAPVLNSPRPCLRGGNCVYKGPAGKEACAFVHPGEEGVGRMFFPARTLPDGRHQPACVRLIGTPEKPCGFYQRRRLNMTWPEWAAKKKLPNLTAAAEAAAKAAEKAINLHQLTHVIAEFLAVVKPNMVDAAQWVEKMTPANIATILIAESSKGGQPVQRLIADKGYFFEKMTDACDMISSEA